MLPPPDALQRTKRLLRDLRRRESRPAATRRIRRRAAAIVAGTPLPAAKPESRTASKSAAKVTPKTATKAAPKSAPKAAPRSRELLWWGQLASAVDVGPVETDGSADPAVQRALVARAKRQAAQATLADALAEGDPLERAVCRAVADLVAVAEWNPAWALAEGAGRLPDGATASTLGHAVLLHRRRFFDRVWPLVEDLDDETLADFIPVEAVDAALATGTETSRERAAGIAAACSDAQPAVLVDLAGRFLAFGEDDLARGLLAELRRRPSFDLDERHRQAWGLIEGWLDPADEPTPPGTVPVAVLQYHSPDHVLTSGNLGDPVQTLALLSNLVRHSQVAFTGGHGLGDLAKELQGLVRPDLRLPGTTGSVHLLELQRDFSSVAHLRQPTWLFAFGWYMHPLFDLRYDFPFHPQVRPLFVSFHVNRLDMLSEEAQEYLRRYGPVGCRDWTTVFLLLSAGIDAFFSGCLTTTIDAVFPARTDVYSGGGAVGLIDPPAGSSDRQISGAQIFSHQSDGYRNLSVAEGVRAAREALAGYQRGLDRAITRRLHGYLPLTALGVPCELKLGAAGDVRLAGLTGLTPGDPRLADMQSGLRNLVARTFEAVAGGDDEDSVYGLWRELTKEAVAEAKARFQAPLDVPPTTIDVDAAVAACRESARQFGPHQQVDPANVTDVVLCFDQNLTQPAAVLVESIVANATRPVRFTILGRGLGDEYPGWLAAAFPDVSMTFMDSGHVAFGPSGRPRRITRRITMSTMDRLLVPLLLEDVERAVYLDVDTVMLGDVTELARTDLQGHPVAARDSNVSEASEWRRAVSSLKDGQRATDLRRRMGLLHGYGSAALNAGVLVMDLDRMRRDDFTRTIFGWIENFGLNDQDAMLAYVGPERAVLEERWNALPVLEEVHDPALVHWASLGKPWEPHLTFGKELWTRHADALKARAGAPPGALTSRAGASVLTGVEQVGTSTAPLGATVERVIREVVKEHLSYLDTTSLRTLAATVQEVEAAGVEGVLIEAGTALGGSAITMAAAKSTGRPLRLYDVFGMIPPPSERDGTDVHRRYAAIAAGRSKGIAGDTYYGYRDDLKSEVSRSFTRHGFPVEEHHVELVAGRFEDTLVVDGPVALAHLDGDWYESTMTCLTRIAPRLSRGGRIIVDDYDTWSGCRTAVDEYFADQSGFRFEHRGRLHVVRA